MVINVLICYYHRLYIFIHFLQHCHEGCHCNPACLFVALDLATLVMYTDVTSQKKYNYNTYYDWLNEIIFIVCQMLPMSQYNKLMSVVWNSAFRMPFLNMLVINELISLRNLYSLNSAKL